MFSQSKSTCCHGNEVLFWFVRLHLSLSIRYRESKKEEVLWELHGVRPPKTRSLSSLKHNPRARRRRLHLLFPIFSTWPASVWKQIPSYRSVPPVCFCRNSSLKSCHQLIVLMPLLRRAGVWLCPWVCVLAGTNIYRHAGASHLPPVSCGWSCTFCQWEQDSLEFSFARFHTDQLSWGTITEHLQCAPVWLCPPSSCTCSHLGSRRPSARKVEDAVNISFDKYFNQKKRNPKEQQQTWWAIPAL